MLYASHEDMQDNIPWIACHAILDGNKKRTFSSFSKLFFCPLKHGRSLLFYEFGVAKRRGGRHGLEYYGERIMAYQKSACSFFSCHYLKHCRIKLQYTDGARLTMPCARLLAMSCLDLRFIGISLKLPCVVARSNVIQSEQHWLLLTFGLAMRVCTQQWMSFDNDSSGD